MPDEPDQTSPKSSQPAPVKLTKTGKPYDPKNPAAHLPKWQKGQSGNPGGRNLGLPSRIKALTNDGNDMIKLFADVASGKIKGTTRDKIEAAKILMDRCFGKAIEFQAIMNMAADETTQGLAGEALEALARELKVRPPAAQLAAPTASETLIVEGELVPAKPSDSQD